MNGTAPRFGRPIETIAAELHCLELASPDPVAMAAFYQRALGFELCGEGDTLLAAAPGRRMAFVEGPAGKLVRAGYALPDRDEFDRLTTRIVRAGATCQQVEAPFFTHAIETRDPDGNRYLFGLPDPDADRANAGAAAPARLQHVVMASRDPGAIVRFFVDALGFTLSDDVVDTHGEIRTSFLRSSSEHHSFAVFKAAENRLDHHSYETTDWNAIRDWCDHMATEQIPLKWGPGRHGPGNNLFAFVHDPDGNWIEISAELEIVEHDRPIGQWPHEERTLNSWGIGLLRS